MVLPGQSEEEDPDRADSRRVEKEFYLSEFRGRTLGLALSQAQPDELPALDEVLRELGANATRCVLLASDRSWLSEVVGDAVVDLAAPTWPARVWRALVDAPRVGVVIGPQDALAARCREVALRLQFAKLVWISSAGGLAGPDGETMSLVDLSTLDGMQVDPTDLPVQASLLRELRAIIEGGVPSVNLCSLAGLADELFTYTGSGTLITRERYILVRPLALHEFDAAHDLLRRGVREGYLAERDPDELDSVLSHAFGVFVEGLYLAGIGALLPYPEARSGEIAALYTITRFLREGVGGRLVRFARDEAVRRGYESLFACTTSPRVESFFERHGFDRVDPEALPAEKWEGYDRARRAAVRCLRCDLADDGAREGRSAPGVA